jgi:hypothetical protein
MGAAGRFGLEERPKPATLYLVMTGYPPQLEHRVNPFVKSSSRHNFVPARDGHVKIRA